MPFQYHEYYCGAMWNSTAISYYWIDYFLSLDDDFVVLESFVHYDTGINKQTMKKKVMFDNLKKLYCKKYVKDCTSLAVLISVMQWGSMVRHPVWEKYG